MSVRDVLFRVVTGLHRAVFRVTGGRILGRAGGMPVVVLTTTGHRTGRRRRTILTAPVVDAQRVVLVASFGGHSHNPRWFQNLLVRPEVGLTMRGTVERPMGARVAGREKKADLWPRIVAAYGGTTPTSAGPIVTSPWSSSSLRRGPVDRSAAPPYRLSS